MRKVFKNFIPALAMGMSPKFNFIRASKAIKLSNKSYKSL